MDNYENFTSLPAHEERSFVVYEQTGRERAKKAKTISMVAAAAFGVIVIAIVFSHSKPPPKITAEDLGDIKKAPAAAPAAAPTPAPTPEPAAAPAGEGSAAPAEGEAKPADGEAAEGEAKPAEGETKPAEGETTP